METIKKHKVTERNKMKLEKQHRTKHKEMNDKVHEVVRRGLNAKNEH